MGHTIWWSSKQQLKIYRHSDANLPVDPVGGVVVMEECFQSLRPMMDIHVEILGFIYIIPCLKIAKYKASFSLYCSRV